MATLVSDVIQVATGSTLKWSDQGDGTVLVWGKAAGPELDLDDQILDPIWLRKAFTDWFRSWANVREQHQPIAAGRAVEHEIRGDEHWLKTVVVDPGTVAKVKAGVLKGYSVGIRAPRLQKDVTARNGRIVDGQIVEVSLVDHPANPTCKIDVLKAAGVAERPAKKPAAEEEMSATEQAEQERSKARRFADTARAAAETASAAADMAEASMRAARMEAEAAREKPALLADDDGDADDVPVTAENVEEAEMPTAVYADDDESADDDSDDEFDDDSDDEEEGDESMDLEDEELADESVDETEDLDIEEEGVEEDDEEDEEPVVAGARRRPAPVKKENKMADDADLVKGDYPGHPFRGNQYTGGISTGAGALARDAKQGARETRHRPGFQGGAHRVGHGENVRGPRPKQWTSIAKYDVNSVRHWSESRLRRSIEKHLHAAGITSANGEVQGGRIRVTINGGKMYVQFGQFKGKAVDPDLVKEQTVDLEVVEGMSFDEVVDMVLQAVMDLLASADTPAEKAAAICEAQSIDELFGMLNKGVINRVLAKTSVDASEFEVRQAFVRTVLTDVLKAARSGSTDAVHESLVGALAALRAVSLEKVPYSPDHLVKAIRSASGAEIAEFRSVLGVDRIEETIEASLDAGFSALLTKFNSLLDAQADRFEERLAKVESMAAPTGVARTRTVNKSVGNPLVEERDRLAAEAAKVTDPVLRDGYLARVAELNKALGLVVP